MKKKQKKQGPTIAERKKINKNVKSPKPVVIKSLVEKIVENLIKLTTVPIEKSVIKWRINKVFGQYYFETEYKDKIYTFDGRHFYVYPAGYELPPGIRIGDKSGPDILLSARIDAALKEFGDLWQVICGQHERELKEDRLKQDKERDLTALRDETERLIALEKTRRILNDFK
ncbi:hypothetical protein A2W54_01575 [Candidatus Giovannonibacteria bacterium RIFCSPHIGHO2_02_43_13]|uniref:Uncharacterized protein n=1 Tax=Candidatus Giovannonibacteria bacterium RIFCSPHIGHO2_02_43_13 TaxID=1798330 RepID=A0A1F5WUS7_9BACT|nr:MAG: hypothetical protein UW28_C0028G0024 [Parcubacteria group bacterium GW2011_GWA2_44_13]OGF79402.1 MAG: hypothetical protein A2W54_01575 [Candidatus Giovannonibacteria bacterium RIFCSPHIGHO2_02_43_13]OGF89898.1 MAG: hypothetical protein A3I94_00690 [Candidatus Giovannonibacteria bacterium RIFCSPLOWO2_02_FULL_43_54]OGF96718.1 MAG: hypothetical protein A3H08_01005 [Candidatus Giovannonibacteria bacterium RIFCSPLOWO2_12_FULL_44_32]